MKHLRENFEGKYLLTKQDPNPFMYEYENDIDSSESLEPKRASYFKSLIGVIMWMIETGHIEIATEVSMLSSFLA